MCLRNVSSRGNSSSGGNSSSFNVSSKCVFASSFTYPPWQKCVFEMCLRLRAEKCVHQCAHNGYLGRQRTCKLADLRLHSMPEQPTTPLLRFRSNFAAPSYLWAVRTSGARYERLPCSGQCRHSQHISTAFLGDLHTCHFWGHQFQLWNQNDSKQFMSLTTFGFYKCYQKRLNDYAYTTMSIVLWPLFSIALPVTGLEPHQNPQTETTCSSSHDSSG